ncbi:MAG: ribonuclease Y [Nitrospirae bacterium]|nr:ribonuclease Y [Nitrospirota bacterium]
METLIIVALIAAGGAFGAGYFISRLATTRKVRENREAGDRILREAEREAEAKRKEAQLEAKEVLYQGRQEIEKETQNKRTELVNLERKLNSRDDQLDRRREQADRRESEVGRREKELAAREQSVEGLRSQYEQNLRQQREVLERLAGVSAEEAKKQIMQVMESEARFESAKEIKRLEDEAKATSEKKAREIITLAIQRYANDHVAECTVSVVHLASDELKGRIIGREGRNIRALEAATGVDFIVDDTPEAVIISGFDSVRREVARQSLERLIADGRIHPTRIEEVVEKVRKELEKGMKEDAEKALFDLGISDVHPEIVRLLGRLKYRTSYGQNNLLHAREVAYVCAIMGAELGLDVTLCKRAALLHDIGKAVDHEEEGGHAVIGGDFARKFGESPNVVNAIASHHGDVEAICPESVLVAAADALSAARPGARRESFEKYIKRLENLERIAVSFKGVEKAYAIQAGREIRVIVKQEEISDAEASLMSRDMAKKIHDDLTYPGQIKVTIIRESRYVEYAK